EPRAVPGADGAPVVYIPSGGSIVKGAAYVADLVARMSVARPELRFFISGPEPKLRDSRVFAPGPLPWADNLAYAASCTLCVSPTLAENLSMAIVEALWLGLPVATFDVGGNRDVVDETCGVLVELGDVAGLADAAVALLRRSELRPRERARDMQERARRDWLALVERA
ncbi:MAG TPA: glycosyltransferase family 4 protein, partial [Kofleriaceae bacterium]|nr:glycosyltransferase family 4 protein [Kofleriaceae bacterium]